MPANEPRRAAFEVEEEARQLYNQLEMNYENSGVPSKVGSPHKWDLLSKVPQAARPIGLGLAAVLGIAIAGLTIRNVFIHNSTPEPSTGLSLESQQVIKQNQLLQEQNKEMQLEMMNHVKDTRPWVLANICLWNCEGRTPNTAAATAENNSPEPSPVPSVSPSPEPVREKVVEKVEKPIIINQVAVPSATNYPYNLIPRSQLNISPSIFKQGINYGYDSEYFYIMLSWYRYVKANDPHRFYKVIVPQAATIPTDLQVEQYDALYLVWSET